MYAGLRRGELRALRWDDVDLGAGLLKVRRSWDDREGEAEPKTKGSQRRVPIVAPLAALLRDHDTTRGVAVPTLCSVGRPRTPSRHQPRDAERSRRGKPQN